MSLSHLLSRGGLVVCSMLIAKYFDSESFANYSYLILTVTTIAIYSAVGIGITTTKFYANLRNDDSSPVFLLGIMSFLFAITGSMVFLIFSDLIIQSNIINQVFVISLMILFMSIDIYASNALIGLEEFKKLFYGSFFSVVINFIAIFYAIFTNDIYYAILGLLLSIFVQTFLNILFLFLSIPKKIIRNISVKKKHFSVISKTMGPMMLVSIFAASGTWIIGKYIINQSNGGLSEFAIFSIGLQWYSLALFIPTMISKVLLPALIKGSSTKNTLKYNCLGIMSLCVFLAYISYLIHPFIVGFYGVEYNISSFYIPIFFIIAGLNACCNILGNKIISSNNELVWLSIVFICFLALNVCCFVFYYLGANLGIIALGVSNTLMILLISIFFISKYNINRC